MVHNIERGKDGDVKKSGITNEISSSSSTGESSIEVKVVSDGEPRSNVSSPPSSTTAGSFDVPDDSGEQESSSLQFRSLDTMDTNEELLALAASVAAKSACAQVNAPTCREEGRTQVVPSKQESPSLEAAKCPKVTSYSSLEGALLGSTVSAKNLSATDNRKGPDGNRPRTSRSSNTKIRSTVPRQKGANSGLRRGKWTVEEETYVARVIQDFNSGFLDAPAGTTLRTFLSEKLKCDPMRITKKFTGEACIGKRVFHPAVRAASNSEAIDKAQAELDELEHRWRRRLDTQQLESAKKAAASVAVAQAAICMPNSPHGKISDTPVTQTASWLDRAKGVLEGQVDDKDQCQDLQSRMQEMQRLIREGPGVQQASADLPNTLEEPSATIPERPKRMRTAEGDAEALVGFLRTVRASVDSSSSLRPPPATD